MTQILSRSISQDEVQFILEEIKSFESETTFLVEKVFFRDHEQIK